PPHAIRERGSRLSCSCRRFSGPTGRGWVESARRATSRMRAEDLVKSAWSERVHQTESAIQRLKARGLAHASVEDARLDGRQIELAGRRLVNFGSCSYLGLETDARLKRAACEAVERYGVVFSSSRAYVSLPLYAEFEALLSEVVGGHPVVVAPTTSLLH